MKNQNSHIASDNDIATLENILPGDYNAKHTPNITQQSHI